MTSVTDCYECTDSKYVALDFSYTVAVTVKAKPIFSQAKGASGLLNVTRMAVAIEMQEDFWTNIYEMVGGHFRGLSFAMSCVS